MTLREYLEKHNLAQHEFAEHVGVRENTVHRWIAGTLRPGWRKMAKIVEVTGGKVTADSFLPPRRSAA